MNSGTSNKKPFPFSNAELSPELSTVAFSRDLIPKQVLYHRGDPAAHIFVVKHGRVRLVSYTSEGRPVPLYVVYPGECISEAALYAEHYSSDVVAEVSSRVTGFPKQALLAAMQSDPQMARQFGEGLSNRFDSLRMRLEIRNLQSARERILQYLKFLAEPDGGSVRLDGPLRNVAEDLGLTHETFYRTLAVLIREGLLTRVKGTISFVSGSDSHRE